jgi:dTDP-4-dehydrorhamnose reductase
MMTTKKIVVTGSNGQLGSELKELAPQFPFFDFQFFTRAELSLNDSEAIANAVASHRPDIVINCAAYTAVDKAEMEIEDAFQINDTAVGILAAACAAHGSKFIHVSTDYVFDGSSREPLTEDAPVGPINVYGKSKLAGERAAAMHNPESVIIRTSWVYSYYGKNFVKTMMRLMGEKESLNVVADQWGSPTYAADLAQVILHISQAQVWQPGIFHYSNEGVITWFDFAKEIGSLIETTTNIHPTTTAAFPTTAKRPLYSVMDKSKIGSHYGIKPKDWRESLRQCIEKLKESPVA